MALSEKDLLLLDCFMYSNISVKHDEMPLERILSKYADADGIIRPENLSKFSFSGDMDAEKMADVMNQMAQSEELKKLRIADSVDSKGGIRGACFVNDSTGEATVAFRGTGGSYKQWYDNLEGYGEVSTPAQRDAAAFIESLEYDNITVTGHSKGGNLAMFVSIVCADKIKYCLSYEGQGFSKEFCEAYAEEIEKAKKQGKIVSISAYNDPVHILMIPIASEQRFVHSDNWPFSHGGYALLTSRWNSFDENGSFTPFSYWFETLDNIILGEITEILAYLSEVPVVGATLEFVADLLGVVAGLVFDSDDWDLAWESIQVAWKELKITVSEDIANIVNMVISKVEKIKSKIKSLFDKRYQPMELSTRIVLETGKLKGYTQRLHKVNNRISGLDKRLDTLYRQVGFLGLWDLLQADLLTGYSWRLNRCASYLNNTANDFEKVENKLKV